MALPGAGGSQLAKVLPDAADNWLLPKGICIPMKGWPFSQLHLAATLGVSFLTRPGWAFSGSSVESTDLFA